MKSTSMFINFFLIVFIVYFLITLFLFFYQRKLLYHPSVNSRSSYTLDHEIDEIKIPSEKELIAWHYKKNENYKDTKIYKYLLQNNYKLTWKGSNSFIFLFQPEQQPV